MRKLCVLIVNYNSTEDCIELIASLRKGTYTDFDTLVFDNNSKDNAGRLEGLKNVILIKSDKNLGLTGGVNKALESIDSKFVFLLNPDIIVDAHTVEELLNIIEKDEKIAFVSGAIYNFKERNRIDSFGGKMNFLTGIGKPLKKEFVARELHYGEYTDACVLMFNRQIFQELRGYDERYFMYAETEDVQLRAMREGYKVLINPRAKVWHKVYGSTGGKKSKTSVYYLTRNRFLFMKKNVSTPRFLLFLFLNILFVLPAQFLLFCIRGQFRLLGSFLTGAFDGIFMRY